MSESTSSLNKKTLVVTRSEFESKIGYSRAVVSGDLIFVAGCTGSAPSSRLAYP